MYEDYQHSDQSPLPSPLPVAAAASSMSCAQGHRSSVILPTEEGGTICLLCFSNLISNPNSPSFHVSYALSQISHAVSQPHFLSQLLSFHFHLILSPLSLSLSSFHDDQIAHQAIDLLSHLCHAGGPDVQGEFVATIAGFLSSTSFVWSPRQRYSLHCLGVLLSRHKDTYTCVKDKAALVYNLVMGLQLPSEEIRGEIMFVLYRLCLFLSAQKDEEGADILLKYSPVLLHLSLDALMKTQRDDVRLNCIALLKVLGERGFLSNAFSNDFNMLDSCGADTYIQTTDEDQMNGTSLTRLFAEAIKSPLLSSDIQVQVAALDFIFHCLSREDWSGKQIEVLVEENVADYIFEILRLSEQKDQVVSPCLQVLHLLSGAQNVFKQRLAIGFTTLVSVLPLVADVPLHPVQPQILTLVLNGISTFPGVVSAKIVEEISNVLTQMLRRHAAGMGMLFETFTAVCSVFVALVKSPSSSAASLIPMLQEASRSAVLASLSMYDEEPNQLLCSLYLLKEAYTYSHESNLFDNGIDTQLRHSVIEVCQKHLLPWFVTIVNEMEEESILGILEILHLILSHGHDNQILELTQSLLSLSWFHLSFQCLGLYTTERMKQRVYLLLGSIVDNVLGDDSGQSIRVSASALPADPVDLLFLLAQKSTDRSELSSCQTAVLQILYVSSFNDEMLADKQLVLASVEQYILANSSLLCRQAQGLITIAPLLNLYGFYRGFAELSYQICYSPEAENMFVQLVTEQDWDLSSFNIHPSSLKWLFQQESISKTLSNQILKLCRNCCSNGTQMNCWIPNFQYIAQLTATGGNLLPDIIISLLEHLAEEMVIDDLVSLLHLLSSIIHSFPGASDQLCLHGIGTAAQILCSNLLLSENRMIFSRFMFIILSAVHTEILHDDEAWCAVIMKFLDSFTSVTMANGWTEEYLSVIGVLSLVLHHSTQGALVQTSRFICVNTSLASLIRASVNELDVDGYTSSELNEGTDAEQALVLLLLFYHFYLRSLQVVLPGTIDWQHFLNQSDGTCAYHSMGILCHDLCKFLHFGSPVIKLVASYCLLELLTGLSDPRNRQQRSLSCSVGYLRSMVVVLEGLVFDTDLRVATNSCLCLSIILSWEIPGVYHTSLVRSNGWCRMIMEELAASLVAPSPVSRSLMDHHRPAVHIARALLKTKSTSPWMKSVFNEACISGIIENLSPNNVSAEVILLFQELIQSAFLEPAQIATLKQTLQACRRRVSMESSEDENMGDQTGKLITISGDLAEVCEFILKLMLSESHPPDIGSDGSHTTDNRLAEEIDLFLGLLPENEHL